MLLYLVSVSSLTVSQSGVIQFVTLLVSKLEGKEKINCRFISHTGGLRKHGKLLVDDSLNFYKFSSLIVREVSASSQLIHQLIGSL